MTEFFKIIRLFAVMSVAEKRALLKVLTELLSYCQGDFE